MHGQRIKQQCNFSEKKLSGNSLVSLQSTFRAKLQLSVETEAELVLPDLGTSKIITETLTRKKFEELNGDIFERLLIPVATALKNAGLSAEHVDEIVLVGGSTRVPKVR